MRFEEIKLHDGVVFELTFADEIKFALVFWEYGEASKILVWAGKSFEIFEYEVRVLSKLYKKVLVGLDAFEFPVVALKHKVEVDFSIAGEFYFYVFREFMLVFHHHFHFQHLWLL